MQTREDPRRAILFVDDEPNLLAALRRTMHSLGDDYSVAFASGADEAISLSENQSFDIVISDMRMPGMDGAELLQMMRRSHPETIRIVLSGQATLEATVRALSATHQYLAKPYSFDKLKCLIKNLSESRNLIGSATIRKHISQIASLPCQKSAVARFQEIVSRSEINRDALLNAIKSDLGLIGTVIHVAMSVNPHGASRIVNIESALQLLSSDSLRAIVDSNSLFLTADGSYHGIELGELARHSLDVASLAKKLATPEANPDLHGAEIAGLLHDIGKLVIAQCFGAMCFDSENSSNRSSAEVARQREILGVSHAEAGAYLLNLWGMPKEVVSAVRDHHTVPPVKGRVLGLGELVYMANITAHRSDPTSSSEDK